MILAFDIGNTNVSAGVYDRGRFIAHWKLRRPPKATRAWWKELTVLVCAEAGVAPADLAGCAVSSVVPAAARPLPGAVRKLTGTDPLLVKGSLPLGVSFAYDDPDRLGSDRVCAMVAAVKKYGTPVVVVDCGTAITIDAVAPRRKHVGGMISPGIAMSAAVLGRSTAALPAAGWEVPLRPAGTDTRGAIHAGVWFTAAGGIRENVRQLKGILGRDAIVVGTGGDAPALMGSAARFDVLDPTLVLEGAALAWVAMRRARARTTSRRPGASR
jgi:type III pantothenate kinase